MEDDELRSEADARVGTTIAGWRLLRLIGIGGMGGVFDAVDPNGEHVAVKVLHRSVALTPNVRSRFRDEALIVARVPHSGVVRVLDAGVSPEGDPYFVMELLRGQSLDDVIRERGGTLPPDEVLAVAAHTLNVLAAAHGASIIHRDLKPENVFLTSDGQLKVLDFGLARVTTEQASGAHRRTRTGILMGTPTFMAPEQARAKWSDVDVRTDIWAVGAMMFYALSGRPVHVGDTVNEILVAASMRPAPSLARFARAPLPVVRIVDKALSFDRKERYADAQSMIAAVVAAVPEVRAARVQSAGTPTVANASRPPPAPSAPPPGASRPAPPLAPSGPPPPAASAIPPDRPSEPKASDLTPEERAARDGYQLAQANDAERATLSSFFALLERGLVMSGQYGLDHPESKRRMSAAIDHALGAIASSQKPLAWNVTPYGFTAGGKPVWEPEAPLDRLAYSLFTDGVRTIAIASGITEAELSRFIRAVTRDRGRDMAPEDDLVTQLWEGSFEHIPYQAIDTFSEGAQDDRSKFENETQGHESLARFSLPGNASLPGRAAVPDTDAAAYQARILTVLQGGDRADLESIVRAEAMLGAKGDAGAARALAVDDAVVRALEARLAAESHEVAPKFLATVALAWHHARQRDTTTSLALPLRAAIDSLAGSDASMAASTAGSMCEAASKDGPEAAAELSRLVITPAVVRSIIEAANAPITNVDPTAVEKLFASLDGGHLHAVRAELGHTTDARVHDALLAYLVRVGSGREAELGGLFAEADVEVGLALIRVLVKMGTDTAKAAILRATSSKHGVVRVEALGHMEGASSERLRVELKALLEDADGEVRLAALRTIEKHKVRVAGPSLVLRIKSPKFDSLSVDERRQALDTLATLAPRRAETVCIELLNDARLLTSEAHEETRLLAVGMLGRVGESDEAKEALERLAGARWRASLRVREAAESAQARISRPPPPKPAAADPSEAGAANTRPGKRS